MVSIIFSKGKEIVIFLSVLIFDAYFFYKLVSDISILETNPEFIGFFAITTSLCILFTALIIKISGLFSKI